MWAVVVRNSGSGWKLEPAIPTLTHSFHDVGNYAYRSSRTTHVLTFRNRVYAVKWWFIRFPDDEPLIAYLTLITNTHCSYLDRSRHNGLSE